LVESLVDGWGDSLDAMEGKFDAGTSTITYQAVYAEYLIFNVTLTKEDLGL